MVNRFFKCREDTAPKQSDSGTEDVIHFIGAGGCSRRLRRTQNGARLLLRGYVYTGWLAVAEDGNYRSTAGVFARDNIAVARKAIYARLLLGAQDEGYH